MHTSITIRKGTPEDIPAVHELVKELAIFEHAESEVKTTPAIFERDAFSDTPWFEFFVACNESGQIHGISLFYYGYSTWKGKMLYLDDLIVSEPYRGQGIGRKLLARTLQHAKEEKIPMVKWQVLDWNEPAIKFYESVGATIDKEWYDCKLFLE